MTTKQLLTAIFEALPTKQRYLMTMAKAHGFKAKPLANGKVLAIEEGEKYRINQVISTVEQMFMWLGY